MKTTPDPVQHRHFVRCLEIKRRLPRDGIACRDYNARVPTVETPIASLKTAADLPLAAGSFWHSRTFGTVCGLIAAVGYSAANVGLRAVAHCDPVWVSAVKAIPTVVLVAPWLVVRARRGLPVWPPWRMIVALSVAGLIGQIGGNVFFQWSLGIVGIALAVPLCLGGQIISSAIFGRIVLGEGITWRMAGAIVLLMTAVFVLSAGAGEAQRSVAATAAQNNWPLLVAGVAAVCSSGIAYSVLGVVIRRGVQREVSLSSILFIVCLVGLVALGAMSFARIGIAEMRATASADFGMMLLAGVCNAVAFLSLTKALQLTSLVYVNALGATQATMAALAGVMFFGEARSTALLTGVALTIVGLLLMSRSQPRRSQ